MNELEPQQTPQEAQAVQTPPAEPPAAPQAETAQPETPEAEAAAPAPAAAQEATAAPEPAAAAAPPAETVAPKAAAAPAAKPAPETRAARPAQKPAQAERAQRRAANERNDRARQAQGREAARTEPRRGPEGPIEIDLEKLIADSLYLDNQAHAIVARMRDMDSGTRSQLRRLFSAVRRACRTSESERQHAFVMLRARLAYTIARHQLRSLDPLEKLLLQVTRKNNARGYERFRDLFEAIVAYNE